jgi:hypothetical protein
MKDLSEPSRIIDEAANLAPLKLLIFETASSFLKEQMIEPQSDTLRDITQRVSVAALRKLRDTATDKAAFEAETKRIVAHVIYEYSRITKTPI